MSNRKKDSSPDEKSMMKGILKKAKEVASTTSVEERVTKLREGVTQRALEGLEGTTMPEEVVYSTWGWFWAMIFSLIITGAVFLTSLANPKFLLFGLLFLFGGILFAGFCLVNMIPEIKIFGFTVFSRKSLSLRQQLSFSAQISRFLGREFLRTHPTFVIFVLIFAALLILSLFTALG